MTSSAQGKPVCVDLDGTLARTDLLIESALVLLKRSPLCVFQLPFWLWKGRARLKRQIAQRTQLDVTTLPYNTALLDWLREEQEAGRHLVLATAADELIANRVAAHCGLFSTVVASDGKCNLAGETKRARLVLLYGERGFVYVGNSSRDLKVWSSAAGAIVVSDRADLPDRVQKRTKLLRVFSPTTNAWKSLAMAMRMPHWIKNVLVFVPLIAAHQLADTPRLGRSVAAFFSFCFCASAIYVLNDLLDLSADRSHPLKRKRPLAAGALSIQAGLWAIPVLLTASLACGSFLGEEFLAILGLYLGLTVFYSFWIKSMVAGDVLCLAGLYTIRLFAGGVAAQIPVSNWLLAFSTFFFLSLALAKRSSELFHLQLRQGNEAGGRGYVVEDLGQISSLGAGCGCLSVLVLALYISSAEVKVFYAHPDRLWLVCPLIFYWISRIWLLTHRGAIQEDPLVFALKDRASYITGLLVLLVLTTATGVGR